MTLGLFKKILTKVMIMKKHQSIGMFLLTCLLCLSAAVQSSEKLVEVRLVDDIDEARGYCLDVAGGQGTRAPLNKGLQAHTCYDYKGRLLEDQSFDPALIKENMFKLPYFDVCMQASSLQASAAIELAKCNGASNQEFSLQQDGHLVLVANPELCVTANMNHKKEGRGGRPVHVMRSLSLQVCSDQAAPFQIWTTLSL